MHIGPHQTMFPTRRSAITFDVMNISELREPWGSCSSCCAIIIELPTRIHNKVRSICSSCSTFEQCAFRSAKYGNEVRIGSVHKNIQTYLYHKCEVLVFKLMGHQEHLWWLPENTHTTDKANGRCEPVVYSRSSQNLPCIIIFDSNVLSPPSR